MTRRIGFALLAAAACVNVATGVALALGDPRRAGDLQVMWDWCRSWLLDGQSLYTGPDASADYPPNAIVMLAPLALVPARWLVPLWTAAAVALTPVLPWLVLRVAAPPRDRGLPAMAIPALLFLCWAAPRTLLQFSLLSMVLACAALLLADTRPRAAGLALGLALCKPQIAGPVALWMLISGRLTSLIAAAAVVAFGWAVYDVRIGEGPLTTAAGYWRVIGSEYSGVQGLVGHMSIRDWTRMAIADVATADALWLALSAGLLSLIGALAWRGRSRALDAGGIAIPGMFSLCSLLVIYHNGNNMILMLPAFVFLWCHVERREPFSYWIPIGMLQAALMFDVPVRLGAIAPRAGWGRVVIEQFDRVLVLVTLMYVSVLWRRLIATPDAVRASRSPR